jgi:hypothetical protein
MEADVLRVQAEERGGLHPVPQNELLLGFPRDLRPASRTLHEDGHREGFGRFAAGPGAKNCLLRRPRSDREQ